MQKKVSFSELIQSEKPVLVDFYATWCGPCIAMGPVLKDVARRLGDQAQIVKIDVDKNPAVAQKYQVRGVPTFMLFRQGKALWRQSGMLSADALEHIILQYSKASV